ncbi:carboxypeptidase M32 [bacterium]|nr:carboxypeptidase M32 [bacterium]
MSAAYERYLEHMQGLHALGSALSLLGWDQETMMPPAAVAHRADVRSHLSGLVHDGTVDPAFGDLLAELQESPLDDDQAANVRETVRDRDRSVKVPRELVTELSRVTSLAQQAWVDARANDDWDRFGPLLAQVVDLRRREAEAVGYEGEPYDALLDAYEPGARAADLAPLFDELRPALAELTREIGERQAPDAAAVLHGTWDQAAQERLSRRILTDMGFDFQAGRLDTSAHPFTGGSHPTDVRLTTAYDPADPAKSLYSTIHEGGHGLYEQGLPAAHAGTPLGEACGLGIHESQSRLWENQVGRSRAFMEYLLPLLREEFPEQAKRLDGDALFAALNVVEPSLIRIDADEVTYNLHIALRFELERDLFRGDIDVEDLPHLWRVRMTEDLGVSPLGDSDGALQDIHWSFGALGYFPTYTLGNLYGATLFAAAGKELGDLDGRIARGEFAPLLDWMRANVHAHGRRWSGDELCRRAAGRGLNTDDFLNHLRAKFGVR